MIGMPELVVLLIIILGGYLAFRTVRSVAKQEGARKPEGAGIPSTPPVSTGVARSGSVRKATSSEHYLLKCSSCGFVHHIPRDHADSTVRYSVDPTEVKMTCVYGGGAFTVTLKVQEFFAIEPTPTSGQVLHASIGDNVKALHGHMLSHCDPLFLQVAQTNNSTHHTYTREQPRTTAFVKFSGNHGIDIVGGINVAKAEIPGVS